MACLVYVHDPMCSWCWAFSRSYQRLSAALPPAITHQRLLGGLAPDSSEPMPLVMRERLQRTWKSIETTLPEVRFNHDFWRLCQPRRATWPACRGVIAARECGQGLDFDLAMTARIQRGYYLQAKNPSDDAVLIEFAKQLGLNADQFEAALNATVTQRRLTEEIAKSQQLGVQGFPALLLLDAAVDSTAAHPMSINPISINFTDADAMLRDINALAASHAA